MSCGIQYVGEYVTNANLRMTIHRCATNQLKNICPGKEFTFYISENLPGNGYRNGPKDSEMLEYRLKREDYCIKIFRFLYP